MRKIINFIKRINPIVLIVLIIAIIYFLYQYMVKKGMIKPANIKQTLKKLTPHIGVNPKGLEDKTTVISTEPITMQEAFKPKDIAQKIDEVKIQHEELGLPTKTDVLKVVNNAE